MTFLIGEIGRRSRALTFYSGEEGRRSESMTFFVVATCPSSDLVKKSKRPLRRRAFSMTFLIDEESRPFEWTKNVIDSRRSAFAPLKNAIALDRPVFRAMKNVVARIDEQTTLTKSVVRSNSVATTLARGSVQSDSHGKRARQSTCVGQLRDTRVFVRCYAQRVPAMATRTFAGLIRARTN